MKDERNATPSTRRLAHALVEPEQQLTAIAVEVNGRLLTTAEIAEGLVKGRRNYLSRLDDFAAALTRLSEEYGFGIAGEPQLYELEPEDRMYSYACDEGRLVRR